MGLPNYLHQILFPRSLKTWNSSVFMTKFNIMYVLLQFEVFIEGGNNIRYK